MYRKTSNSFPSTVSIVHYWLTLKMVLCLSSFITTDAEQNGLFQNVVPWHAVESREGISTHTHK